MTRARTCGELRRELGVYLLGALAPAERGAVETHLASCARCRDQLADLAGLPALLRRVSVDEVDSLSQADDSGGRCAPPDGSLGSLLGQAAKRKRYRTLSQLAATAAAGLAIGGATAYGAFGSPPRQPAALPPTGATTVRGSNPRTDATAVVSYTARPWGVQLYVQVNHIAAGTHCVLEVTDSGGHESEAANWTVARNEGTTWYMASSSVPATHIRGFVVTAGGLVLVRVDAAVPRSRIAGPR